MPNQNRDQAEQIIAEELVAACLVIESGGGSAKDRSLVRRVLQSTAEALRAQKISVHSQADAISEVQLPSAAQQRSSTLAARKVVMKRRGRQVVLDLARLRSYGALMNVDNWCKSALRSNLLQAFKILGQPELR
ncbi:hypothetical protein ACIPW4_13080 [Pseudomonas sp. NPDC089996]|uniref:hypothetical protein n=1 Tax=Pseudomonas sp. NPDC089996 TaxID=3364474 RepID=UPI00381D0A01